MALVPRVNWGSRVPVSGLGRSCLCQPGQWDLTFGKAGMMDSWIGRG